MNEIDKLVKDARETITELMVAADIAKESKSIVGLGPSKTRAAAVMIQRLYNQLLIQRGMIESLERRNAVLLDSEAALQQVLMDTDDTLCEIASGNQGSFKPHHSTVRMAHLGIDRLRAALPLEDRND